MPIGVYTRTEKHRIQSIINLKEGFFGKKHTKESKIIMSNNRKGKTAGEKHFRFGKLFPQEVAKKISIALTGRKLSQEHCRRISETHPDFKGEKHPFFGKHHTVESKLKISLAKKGIKQSLGSILKRSISMKGKICSEETRKKIGLANSIKLKGRQLSKETRIKISQSRIGNKHWNWKGGVSKDKRKYTEKRRLLSSGLTPKDIQLVYEDNIKKFGTLTCIYCLKPIEFGKDNLEHKMPLSRGGNNLYENLGVACKKCNEKKHTKTEEEFRKECAI